MPLIYTFCLFSSTSFFVCLYIFLYSVKSQRPNRNQWLMYPIAFNLGVLLALVVKTLLTMQETWDTGSIPGLTRSPGEGSSSSVHILAWRIPWTEEPGRLQSIGSQRVRHGWSNLACTHIAFNSEGVLFHCLAFCDFYLVPFSSVDIQKWNKSSFG